MPYEHHRHRGNRLDAFWNNICSAGTLGIVIAMVIVCLLLGFAFGRTMGAFNFALRAVSAIVGVVLIIGFLGVLGISMSMLNPLINWLLEIVHAPVYLPEA